MVQTRLPDADSGAEEISNDKWCVKITENWVDVFMSIIFTVFVRRFIEKNQDDNTPEEEREKQRKQDELEFARK